MSLLLNSSTSISLWQEIIHDAEASCSVRLHEELESYLIFLMMRFTNQPDIVKQIMATDFLKGLKLTKNQKLYHLQEVGDKCLIYSGLFPKNAEKRHVKISYFVNLGQSAYSIISYKHNDLYALLANHFVTLMDILQAIRQHSKHYPDLLPFEAYDLWTDTGSRRALSVLKNYTKDGAVIIDLKQKR